MSGISQHNCAFGGYLMDLNDQINDLESFLHESSACFINFVTVSSFYSHENEQSQRNTSHLFVVFDVC